MKIDNLRDDLSDFNNELLSDKELTDDVFLVLDGLNRGIIRSANRDQNGLWHPNVRAKKAILLYFKINKTTKIDSGAFTFFDKIPLRTDFEEIGVRAVPGAIVRYGSFVEDGVILMPSFVNIGAYVGACTMIDTWSTVGSSAQIGKRCHISGGVGIGGVLEPVGARPVIIEDDVFIGARSEIAEGVIIRERAVISMGVFIGASSKIFDARPESFGKIHTGEVPKGSVVIAGNMKKNINDNGKILGSIYTYSPIIIKTRDEKTDAKTTLNDILR